MGRCPGYIVNRRKLPPSLTHIRDSAHRHTYRDLRWRYGVRVPLRNSPQEKEPALLVIPWERRLQRLCSNPRAVKLNL